jgi:hypothetical protein
MAAALVGLGGTGPQVREGPLGIFRVVGFDEWAALGDRYR